MFPLLLADLELFVPVLDRGQRLGSATVAYRLGYSSFRDAVSARYLSVSTAPALTINARGNALASMNAQFETFLKQSKSGWATTRSKSIHGSNTSRDASLSTRKAWGVGDGGSTQRSGSATSRIASSGSMSARPRSAAGVRSTPRASPAGKSFRTPDGKKGSLTTTPGRQNATPLEDSRVARSKAQRRLMRHLGEMHTELVVDAEAEADVEEAATANAAELDIIAREWAVQKVQDQQQKLSDKIQCGMAMSDLSESELSLKHARARIRELEQALDIQHKENRKGLADRRQLNLRLAETADAVKSSENQLADKVAELNNLHAAMNSVEGTGAEGRFAIAEGSRLRAQLRVLHAEKVSHATERRELQSRVEMLESNLHETLAKLKETENQASKLGKELSRADDRVEVLETAMEEAGKEAIRIAKMKAESEKIAIQLEDAETARDDAEAAMIPLRHQVRRHQDDLRGWERKVATLDKTREALQTQVQDRDQELRKQRSSVESLQAQLEDQTTTSIERSRDVARINEKLKMTESAQKDLKARAALTSELEIEVDNKTSKINELQDQVVELTASLKKQTELYDDSQSELVDVQFQLEKIQKAHDEVSDGEGEEVDFHTPMKTDFIQTKDLKNMLKRSLSVRVGDGAGSGDSSPSGSVGSGDGTPGTPVPGSAGSGWSKVRGRKGSISSIGALLGAGRRMSMSATNVLNGVSLNTATSPLPPRPLSQSQLRSNSFTPEEAAAAATAIYAAQQAQAQQAHSQEQQQSATGGTLSVSTSVSPSFSPSPGSASPVQADPSATRRPLFPALASGAIPTPLPEGDVGVGDINVGELAALTEGSAVRSPVSGISMRSLDALAIAVSESGDNDDIYDVDDGESMESEDDIDGAMALEIMQQELESRHVQMVTDLESKHATVVTKLKATIVNLKEQVAKLTPPATCEGSTTTRLDVTELEITLRNQRDEVALLKQTLAELPAENASPLKHGSVKTKTPLRETHPTDTSTDTDSHPTPAEPSKRQQVIDRLAAVEIEIEWGTQALVTFEPERALSIAMEAMEIAQKESAEAKRDVDNMKHTLTELSEVNQELVDAALSKMEHVTRSLKVASTDLSKMRLTPEAIEVLRMCGTEINTLARDLSTSAKQRNEIVESLELAREDLYILKEDQKDFCDQIIDLKRRLRESESNLDVERGRNEQFKTAFDRRLVPLLGRVEYLSNELLRYKPKGDSNGPGLVPKHEKMLTWPDSKPVTGVWSCCAKTEAGALGCQSHPTHATDLCKCTHCNHLLERTALAKFRVPGECWYHPGIVATTRWGGAVWTCCNAVAAQTPIIDGNDALPIWKGYPMQTGEGCTKGRHAVADLTKCPRCHGEPKGTCMHHTGEWCEERKVVRVPPPAIWREAS